MYHQMAKCTKSEDVIEMTTETDRNSPLELSISKENKEKVSDLLVELSKLSNIEKIYMHLNLPPCPVIEDEIKSDSPPSGSAYRTSTTLNWIQSHYVEDRRVCLPKQEVYSHYKLYCDTNGINPFAMSDFGKVMKTAFPSVHDRRLGQRGKSKYFYGGLRRKSSSGDDPDSSRMEDQQPSDHEEELESLSSQLVCEWASCLLGKNFSSIKSFAHYLVCSGASCGKKAALYNMLTDMDGWSQDSQALLQRKILQKEVLKEHKALLKHQEANQKDTQAALPTAARLAVLSPSLHALHSSDASGSLPCRPHVLNVARNNSASSTPVLPTRQENSEMSVDVVNSKNASVVYTSIIESDKSKMCTYSNETLDINKNISVSSGVALEADKEKANDVHSFLVPSKSLAESIQRQPKRNCEFLYNTTQDGNSKRRCITSLGMAGLMKQSSTSVEQSSESLGEAAITRPLSCPVFNGVLQSSTCNMESEEIQTVESDQVSETAQLPKEPHSSSDINISSSDNDDDGSKPKPKSSSPSSFHFVRKPTVISIKPSELNENNDPLHYSIGDQACDDNSAHASHEKKSHRIMNSILSSSDSNIPHHFSSGSGNVPSFAALPYGDSQMTSDTCSGEKGNDRTVRREAHTLDNAYLLPCQSSRSAFVRVMNGKGHKRSEIIPRLRLSSFDSPFESGQIKQNETGETPNVCGDYMEPQVSVGQSGPVDNKSSVEVNEGTEPGPDGDFKSISLSSNSKVPSTVAEVSKENGSEITTPVSSSSSTQSVSQNTSIKSIPAEPQLSSSVHLITSPTITSPVHTKRMTSKSPVTPPKRHQSRSRFTPIRPKISNTCNVSPQKKDNRSVATILKEQRARSAQELLVNLASSYQGGIKLQLSSDIFGVSADKTTNSIPTVISSLGNQSISCPAAVILEPVSLSTPITTQASPLISPHKIISSTSSSTTVSPAPNTLSRLLTRDVRVSEAANVCVTTNSHSVVPSSSTIVSSTHSIPVQSPVIVSDANRSLYNLGNAEMGKPPPRVSSLQQLLQGSTDTMKPQGIIPLHQNVINMSNIKGHVLGPDASGQTFLLVPNSESSTLIPNQNSLVTSGTGVVGPFSPPKQKHSLVTKLTSGGVSSAALLSELSQLASVSNDSNIAKQPVIKHDSTLSAFQKCEPNKYVSDSHVDDKSQAKVGPNNQSETASSTTMEKEDSSDDHGSMSCDEISNSLEVGADTCLRKRKASKGQDDKLNEKKRHNTDSNEGDDLVFVKADNTVHKNKEDIVREGRLSASKETAGSTIPSSSRETDMSDTEALLNLIDSKSMTVKQTVLAMNSLKAQMKMSGLSLPTAKAAEVDSSVKLGIEESRQVTEKSAQRSLHVIRRNTSLNLESLESDALLDTELFLDNHLVEDIKHCKSGNTDLKTSVAVAAKSHRSHSRERQKDQSKRIKDSTPKHTISPKALHSYQMILNERSKSLKEKEDDKDMSGKPSTLPDAKHYKDFILTGHTLQRRCVSSVQEMLQNGSQPLPFAPAGHPDSKSQSEVDAFDALLSKMYSKQIPSSEGNGTRSRSSLLQDSELPGDIVDFVTESMSSRRDSLEGHSEPRVSKPFKPPESIVARSISVPNTKPDFIDAEQAHVNLVCSRLSNTSQLGSQSSQLFLLPTAGDNSASIDETGAPAAKNVFLSPIGPAKLARRSSVEKSITQGHTDRSITRTPAEMSSPTSMSPSMLNKDRCAIDVCASGQSKMQQHSERHHRTKTPVDRILVAKHRSQTPVLHSVDKGYKSPVNRALAKTPSEKCFVKQSSDPFSPRSDLMFPVLLSARREEASSVVSDGGYSSGSVSQTPSSDSGRNSISQTPISDCGYSSVSPSPVMMSSTAYLGECGRNLSPATIFMPLRSDSALSVNNNNPRSESPSTTHSNHVELLPGFANSSCSENPSTNVLKDTQAREDQERQSPPHFTSADLPKFPFLLDTLGSKALLLDDMDAKKDSSKTITPCSNTNTLLKLLTSSIQSIPTPPVSPSNSPPNTLPLPFSIPSPQLPCSATSPLTIPLSTGPCFIPPMSSSSSSSSLYSAHNHHGRHFGPSPHFRSQELPSPALAGHSTHSYTPSPHILARPPSSPHILARPPSSPHPYSSHPSPPFTPCSLRSLPSPRCMTPISHKSLISPRSVTPSSDPSQAAPNRFMPIQSSGVLPISQTSTHTYIQPIRPVVALASASSSHTNNTIDNNFGVVSTCISQNSISRSLITFPPPQNTTDNSRLTHGLPLTFPSNSLPYSLRQGIDRLDSISTSEHKPLEANSTLVLSLSEDISPLSNRLNLTLGNVSESPHQNQAGYANQSASDSLHQSRDSVNNLFIRNQNFQQSSQSQSSTSPHTYPHRHKPRDSYSSSSSSSPGMKLQTATQSNCRVPSNGSRALLINTASSPSRAFKPPLSQTLPSSSSSSPSSSSLSVCSFKPVSSLTTVHHPHISTLDSRQTHPVIGTEVQDAQTVTDKPMKVISTQHHGRHDPEKPWVSNANYHQSLQHLVASDSSTSVPNPTPQDALQETLDVLKDMDGDYFLGIGGQSPMGVDP